MKILIIRHGEQSSRVCNADVPLSERGKEQAERLAADKTMQGIEAVYASGLTRARQTAEIIAGAAGVPVIIRSGLAEMDFGEFTGLSHAERIEREKRLSAETHGRLSGRPYPGGESYEEVFGRIRPVLEEITSSGYECAAVVSHLEAIRAMLSGMIGLPFDHAKLLCKGLPHTGTAEIFYDRDRGLYFLRKLG